ncbi:glycosyltransferase family 4 protein [Pendulispora rubella]|uniref:Glycosyltransferase family 4 protein n=1 Tax=Pendulispora rubella TaxID=2741070 RepID=A0ABZ2LFP7_9BACT
MMNGAAPNVLFLNPVGELGGGEMSLLDLMSSLRALAPQASLSLVTGSDGPLIDAAKALAVDVRVLPLPAAAASVGDATLAAVSPWERARLALRGSEMVAYVARLASVVRAASPGVIHSNGIKMHLLGAAVRPRSTPLVWHVRDFLGARSFSARMIRMARHRADLAIANSHAVAEDFRTVAPDLHVRVMHNGVDTSRFTPEGRTAPLDAMASLPPLPEGGVRVGLIATYARWKGHDVFFECAKRLLQRSGVPPMRFYIIGSPIYTTGRAGQYSFEELRALAESHGIAEHVGFVPFQLRPDDVYRALDVVVHASTRPEPFGRTIVEAMASGRAVVVSRAGGAAELYDEGVDALGVPPGDAEAMAERVAQLASDASLRSSLGSAARKTAERRFARDRLGAELLAIYADLFREGIRPSARRSSFA